ncbi:hypothetical protein [Shinella sp. BYT-45]|uniref:hypothetical protein n=1 Tax=Shinella sp. BYT-45 TaxID=3377377 RepID=UPI00397FF189
MATGVRLTDKESSATVESLVGLRTNPVTKVTPIAVDDLAEQLLGGEIGDAIAGAAAGLKSAKTWAELSAVVGTAELQKGEVTDDAGTHTDPVTGLTVPNMGTYSWSASPAGWTRTGDYADPATAVEAKAAADVAATTAVGASVVAGEAGIWQLSGNNLGVTFAISADDGKMPWGVLPDGSYYAGALLTEINYAGNNLGLVDGLVGAGGRLLWGVDRWGGEWIGGQYSEPLGSNNLGLIWGIVGDDGKVPLGVRSDGSLIGALALQDVGAVVWEAGGNLYGLLGTQEVQLTSTGKYDLPRVVGEHVHFRSTRRRDVSMTYRVAYNNPGKLEVFYASRKANEASFTIGQSLAEGGDVAITTTPPFPSNALKFANGPVGKQSEVLTGPLVPLAEAVNETISTGMARNILADELDRTLVMAGQAWGGKTYAELKKGAADGVYEKVIAQAVYLAGLPGGAHCRAVNVIHGEADGLISNVNYDADLREWLDDLNEDIRGALDQSDRIVMLTCQTSSAAGYRSIGVRDTFTTPFLQLKASEENDDIFLVGPKYHLTYLDHSHIDAASTRLWGEYYGKVYRRVVIEGEDWRPLSPATITVDGSDVVIDCHVPVAPIVIDTTAVTDPGNLGFNLLDAGGATITGVSVTGPAQITVALSAPPQTGWRLSYAFHNGAASAGSNSGPTTGCRGCIRDSDPTLSAYTVAPLRNWLVAFQHIF